MQTNFIDHLLQTLSWTFIHSLWMGLILSTVAGLIMLVTKKSAASLRYALLTGSFFLFLPGLITCFVVEWNSSFDRSSIQSLQDVIVNGEAGFHQLWIRSILSYISKFLTENSFWIVLAWSVVICLKAIKMSLDLLSVSRLRSQQVYSPEKEWSLRLKTLAASIKIKKPVSMVESAMIKVPVVIGHLRPMILMPVGILNNLSAGEVEAVLLHELAHIRRHDYLVNFIQRITETILFFNPAFLWVSSLIRIEREHCCDDIAIAKTENRLQFAEALISFKEYSMAPQPYAIGLFGKKSLLLHRMTRIVYKRNNTLSTFEFTFFAINIVVILLLILGKGERTTPAIVENSPLASYMDHDPVIFKAEVPQPEVSLDAKKENDAFFTKKTEKRTRSKTANVSQPVRQEHLEEKEQYIADQEKLHELIDEQVKYKNDQQRDAVQRLLAEHDRAEAEIHRKEAEKSRLTAEQDRKRAEIDRMNAAALREQAEKDRQQAEKDRQQAQRDREAADVRRKKADEERKQFALSIQRL